MTSSLIQLSLPLSLEFLIMQAILVFKIVGFGQENQDPVCSHPAKAPGATFDPATRPQTGP